MNSFHKHLSAVMAIGILFITASCSRVQAPIKPTVAEGDKQVVEMKASSFSFDPNNIEAKQGDTLLIKIRNVSSTAHNLTLKDPKGRIIQSADLPPNETVTMAVELPVAGTYEFYCDKPLHPTLGMKGKIQVGPGA
jgi:plastocyanin